MNKPGTTSLSAAVFFGLLIGTAPLYGPGHRLLYGLISVVFGLAHGMYGTKRYLDHPDASKLAMAGEAFYQKYRDARLPGRILVWLMRPPHCPTIRSFVITVAIFCLLTSIDLKYGEFSLACFLFACLGWYIGRSFAIFRSARLLKTDIIGPQS